MRDQQNFWSGLGGISADAWALMEHEPAKWMEVLKAWADHTEKHARYRFVNKGSRQGEITLYGPIGADFFGEGITSSSFKKQLDALGDVRDINVRIDSPGGAVMDARTIYTHLTQHPAKVNVYIDGLAASAASVIAMAGDTINVAEGGFVMIHEARSVARGTASELRAAADVVDKANTTIVDTYVRRTGQSKKKIVDWMAAETWFTGAEAVANGFATSVMENKGSGAKASAYAQAFGNMPKQLLPGRAQARAILERVQRRAALRKGKK